MERGRAQSIDAEKALAVFEDGKPHGPRDVAIAAQVHTRVAVWFLCAMEARGRLRRLPTVMLQRAPEFSEFEAII